MEQWPKDSEKMQTGLSSGDLTAVIRVAHALKGTVALFGAQPIADLAHEIEQRALKEDASGVAVRLELLEVEMNRLIPLIPTTTEND